MVLLFYFLSLCFDDGYITVVTNILLVSAFVVFLLVIGSNYAIVIDNHNVA